LAVTLAVLAASSEGAYALYDLYAHGQPLAGVRELNIDALASWFFNGLRIDGLPRSMWYNPQHSMASALGLIVLPVAGLAGVSASLATIVVSGVALGAAVTFNPFIGAVFAAAYAITVAIDAILTRRVAGTIRHLAAAAIVMAAVWWSIANQMVEGAGGALQVGLHRYARSAPLRTLLLSIGPLVVPAAVGLFTPLRVPRRVWPAFAAVVLSLLLFYFVSLNVDRFWVGFRAGQILLITLPVLAARAFAALCRIRAACAVAFAACFAIGLPTTAIDVYNAQDIANREMGPGFHWTIVITPQEQTALDWIRRHTDPRAIVQMEPIVRGRETWTLIPSFAERRMAAGLPISLLNVPEYRSRSESVRSMYDTRDGAAAWRTARELGIDYVYADHVEREAYPEDALAKFDSSPQYFTRIFQTGEVRIWQVRKDQTLAR
ncbi:MAG: hypothetical protein HYX76_03965, partial [Acidobacteria bacterium]|nr:hypothetical protein [Acidobacteriota bacterium]